MNDHRHFAALSGENDGNGYEAAFGEDHIRLQLFNEFARFTEALQNAERIRQVLHAQVAAELAG